MTASGAASNTTSGSTPGAGSGAAPDTGSEATPTSKPSAAARASGDAARAVLRPGDVGLIVLVTALIRWVSGAERFTFLHTPDSEFYFSLGAFGSAVTDRAPYDSYYWTKLGIILPVRGLVAAGLDPVVALDVFHAGLLLLVVGSAYVVARLHWSRLGSCAAAAFAGLNTVVLGFLGDPYASGAALAGLFLLLATAIVGVRGQRPLWWLPAALAGAVGAWLVMINPFALIVGAAGCAGILLAGAPEVIGAGPVRVGRAALMKAGLAAVGGFVAAFATFLALGSQVFPGKSWFASLRAFLGANDLSSWAAKDWAWLPSETSLLVPASAAVVALIAVVATPRSVPMRTGAALIWLTLAVSVGYKLVSDSNVLEHSVYSSMLWPAALLSLILVASGTAEPPMGWASVALVVTAAVAWIAAGHWTAVLSPTGAAVLAGVGVLTSAALLAWGRRGRVLVSAAWQVASVGLVLLVILGSMFQVLANGRPQDPTKLHRRVLYSQAFVPNDSQALLIQDAAVQAWLVGATDAREQLLVWNTTQTRSAASMQLWGPNTVGSGFGGPLGASGMATVRAVAPDAVVVYAPNLAEMHAIRDELEAEWAVAEPACRTFPGVPFSGGTVPDMLVCVLRLTESV